MIESIDTFYNGNYFRSRLEARWAVYFDLIGLKYEYEPNGFKFKNRYNYLPDFFLPEQNLYCEIKNKNAYWIDGGRHLRNPSAYNNKDAFRYVKISEELMRESIPWVMFLGTPYDYLYNNQEWWYCQMFSEYNDIMTEKIMTIFTEDNKNAAEEAARIRFEHGESAEQFVEKHKMHRKTLYPIEWDRYFGEDVQIDKEISIRAYNTLLRGEVSTIYQLILLARNGGQGLLKIRNCGNKTANELIGWLNKHYHGWDETQKGKADT